MKKLNVKKIREALGLSREEFAAKFPVDAATVWRWEQEDDWKKGPHPMFRARLEELAREAKKGHIE